MFQLISDENKIDYLHKEFSRILRKYESEKIKVIVGHSGYSSARTISYSKDLDIWWLFNPLENRYWNAFGIGKPDEGKNVSIVCEINYPIKGINLRIAAGFAANDFNQIFLVHSGKIGGGRKGVGKSLFIENYASEKFQPIKVRNKILLYPIVGELIGDKFPHQLKLFIEEIDRIKKLVANPEKKSKEQDLKTIFDDEFFGEKEISKYFKSTAICNHGLIVNTLKEILQDSGFKVANDKYRDVYIFDRDKNIVFLFEVKTDIFSQSVYTAIGQLFFYNITQSNPAQIYIVLPVSDKAKLKKNLNKLKINILEYKWLNSKLIFLNIDKLINNIRLHITHKPLAVKKF